LGDFTRAYGVPCISGKDSMKNDAQLGDVKISIPPTLLFSAIGRIRDVGRSMTPDVKFPGDIVYVLGGTRRETGGSEFLAMRGEEDRGRPYLGEGVPRVEPRGAMKLYRALHQAIGEGLVHSAHTPHLGGLGIGLAMAAMGGELGMEIRLDAVPREASVREDWVVLFSESNSRFIVTVSPQSAGRFEEILSGLPVAAVGRVIAEQRLRIDGLDGARVIDGDLVRMKERWKGVMRGM
jgi:phosphoribosylformylglycinamidine synthase